MERHAHERGRGHPRGRGNNVLPPHLQHPMPTYIMWLEARVKDLVVACATIDKELVQLSCPPSRITYTHVAIWKPFSNGPKNYKAYTLDKRYWSCMHISSSKSKLNAKSK